MQSNAKKNGHGKEPEAVPRRRILGWLVSVINIGVLASLVTPTLGFLAAPLRRRKEPGVWIPVLKADELADGETRTVTYQIKVKDGYMDSERQYNAFLYRKGQEIVGYDPSCPHLGCHVEFKARKKRYVCPCHGGVFDEEGNRLSGPPPTGLTKITTKVENGQIWLYKG